MTEFPDELYAQGGPADGRTISAFDVGMSYSPFRDSYTAAMVIAVYVHFPQVVNIGGKVSTLGFWAMYERPSPRHERVTFTGIEWICPDVPILDLAHRE